MRLRLTALLTLALAAPAQAAEPDIDSPAAIVMETRTGDVIYEKAADARRPMASTTKLMTALLTLENGDLRATVSAPRYRAAPGESVVGLIAGEQITVADLTRALLVASANDAAVALAVRVGDSLPSFVRQMNRRAQQLGLTNTHYANPIGLDEVGNYSSPRDLATLTRTLRKRRFFRRTVDTRDLTLRSGARERLLSNRNTLLFDYQWVDGVKTGFTSDAGNVLVSSGAKRGVHLIAVVMGASSKTARNDESAELLNYGFTKYRLERPIIAGDQMATIPIRHRAGAKLPVVASRTVRQVIRKDEDFRITTTVPDDIPGPVAYGDKVGQVVVELRGRTVATVPLTAALAVPAAGAGRQTQDFLTQPWLLVILGAVLLLATLVTHRRTPPRRERVAR